MDLGALVSGETDVANLSGLLCGERGFEAAVFAENDFRIGHPDHFMELQQVEMIGLQTLEGLVDLLGGRFARVAVDFGHQENPLAIAVAQRLAHPHARFRRRGSPSSCP